MSLPGVDTISIGVIPAPGQWILQPCSREFGWQINKGFALSGASVFPTGDELLVAPFLIKIWTDAQYDLFVPFAAQFLKKAVISPGGGFTAFAMGITHPELQRLGIQSFVVKKHPVLTRNEKGLWTGVAEFLEYRKPVPALGKPNAAIPGAATPVPTATDKLDAEILRRRAQRAASRGP